MNQEEKTRVLAEKVMGWHYDRCTTVLGLHEWWVGPNVTKDVKDWNPYESIADSFMVLEKVKSLPRPSTRFGDDPWDKFCSALSRGVDFTGIEQVFLGDVLDNLTPATIADAALEAITALAHTTGDTDPSGVKKDAGAIPI